MRFSDKPVSDKPVSDKPGVTVLENIQSHLGYPTQFVARILAGQQRLLDK